MEAWSLADRILLEALHFLKCTKEKSSSQNNHDIDANYYAGLVNTNTLLNTLGCTCQRTRQLRSAWCKLG